MTDTQETPAQTIASRWKFGLRSLLLVTLLVATYFAGWQSHKIFHNRNLKEHVAAAMQEIKRRNVEVETIDELGLTVVRGQKENVEAAQAVIGVVQSAAAE